MKSFWDWLCVFISFCIRSAITVKCLHVTSFLSESWHQWHLGDVFMTLSSVNHSLWSLLADNQTTRVTAVSSPRDCLRMFWIGKNTGKEWGVREGYIHRRVDRCGGTVGRGVGGTLERCGHIAAAFLRACFFCLLLSLTLYIDNCCYKNCCIS